MNELIKKLLNFWSFVFISDDDFSKLDARLYLLSILKELNIIFNNNHNLIDLEFKYEIYSMILNYFNILENIPDNPINLKIGSILMLNKGKPLYYILDNLSYNYICI